MTCDAKYVTHLLEIVAPLCSACSPNGQPALGTRAATGSCGCVMNTGAKENSIPFRTELKVEKKKSENGVQLIRFRDNDGLSEGFVFRSAD